MTFQGAFDIGESVRLTVRWTLASDVTPITGSTVTLTYSDGTVVGPIDADSSETNVYTTIITPTVPGNVKVRWETEPPGGVATGWFYVQ